MFKWAAYFACIFPVTATFAATEWIQHILEENEAKIEQALIDYQVPGIAIGVIAEGKLVYAKGFGYRDNEEKLPVTTETVFPIGSCSKAFASFLIGTFVDEKKISWDERVIDLLPDFRLRDEHAMLHTTLRDLLTHRSGLPRHGFMWYGSNSLKRSEILYRLRYLEPSCDLRERYQYSDLMYLVAGCAIEKLAGQSWEELVAQRILAPLQMTKTGFNLKEMLDTHNFASPYLEKEGTVKKMSFRDISVICPAGGMHSNILDLAHWVTLHLQEGVFNHTSVIRPAVLQEMHAPQTIVPESLPSNASLIDTYGLGWHVVPYRGHYYVSHDGGVDGFTSLVGFFPKEQIGIVILANKNLTSLPRYLSNHFIDRILGLPETDWLQIGFEGVQKVREAQEQQKNKEDISRKTGTVPTHPLEDFVGDYTHPGYGTVSIEICNGKLSAVLNGLRCFLDHWHYDTFVLAEESQDMVLTREGMKFSFHIGIDGEIEKLAIPFEPIAGDVVFLKQQQDSLSNISYLKQFTGTYEVYGYLVEVVLRNSVLCGIIPGQPVYELIPKAKNEFSVKSLAGYCVRFSLDADQTITEMVLMQPYGAIAAKPKKS